MQDRFCLFNSRRTQHSLNWSSWLKRTRSEKYKWRRGIENVFLIEIKAAWWSQRWMLTCTFLKNHRMATAICSSALHSDTHAIDHFDVSRPQNCEVAFGRKEKWQVSELSVDAKSWQEPGTWHHCSPTPPFPFLLPLIAHQHTARVCLQIARRGIVVVNRPQY